MLAQAIAERSGREPISEVFLFAGCVLRTALRKHPSPNSSAKCWSRTACRVRRLRMTIASAAWQLMYQLMESDAWVITDNCAKLIETLPQLVRDDRRMERYSQGGWR